MPAKLHVSIGFFSNMLQKLVFQKSNSYEYYMSYIRIILFFCLKPFNSFVLPLNKG